MLAQRSSAASASYSPFLICPVAHSGEVKPVLATSQTRTFSHQAPLLASKDDADDSFGGFKMPPAQARHKKTATPAEPRQPVDRKSVAPVTTTTSTADSVPAQAPTAGEEEEEEEKPVFVNPVTGEVGGYRGPEPTKFGDWAHKGRVSDF
jgi:hypothetical protein